MSKKLWKILGGCLGVGAVCCIIPACVVSCGSSSNTTTNNTSTATQPTSPNTTTAPSTNSNYYVDNKYSTPTMVATSNTPAPFNVYAGGSTSAVSIQSTGKNTYDINLQLTKKASTTPNAVLTSFKQTPTLLAIVPTQQFSVPLVSSDTMNANTQLLLQAIPTMPLTTKEGDNNYLAVQMNFVLKGTKVLDGGTEDLQIPLLRNGEYNFGTVPETFHIMFGDTPYTFNLDVNFAPYLVKNPTPLTASDFNLSTPMTTNPNIEGATYTKGESYQSYYTVNKSILDNPDKPVAIPIPLPFQDQASQWLNWPTYNNTPYVSYNWQGMPPLYVLQADQQVAEYTFTNATMTKLINALLDISSANQQIQKLNAEIQQLNQYEQTIQNLKNTNSQDQNTITQATTQLKADQKAQTEANNTLNQANTQIQNDENTIQNLQNQISQDNQLVQQLKYLATTELPNSVRYSYNSTGLQNPLDNATLYYTYQTYIYVPTPPADDYNYSVSGTLYEGTVNSTTTNPIPTSPDWFIQHFSNEWELSNLRNGSYTLVTQITTNGMTSKKTYTPFTVSATR